MPTTHHDLYCRLVQAMRYLRHLETIGCHAQTAHCDGTHITILIDAPPAAVAAGWSWSYVAQAARVRTAPVVCRMVSDDLTVEWLDTRTRRRPAPLAVARALGRAAA